MENESQIKKIAGKLENELQSIGIYGIDAERLFNVLKSNANSIGHWTILNDVKVKLDIRIAKDADESCHISFYNASFVPKLPVEFTTINGVDTNALERKMMTADWHFANSESEEELTNEFNKVEEIESEIEILLKNKEGIEIATILWNNYVPFYGATKPELIRQYEDNGDLYIKQQFDGNTPLSAAFDTLEKSLEAKLQQEVNEKFEEIDLNLGDEFYNFPPIMTTQSECEIITKEIVPGEIQKYLEEQKLDGKKWVVFDAGTPLIELYHLNCFKTDFEVGEFRYDNTTDRDFYESMAISDFERELEKWEKLKNNPKPLTEYLENKMKYADWDYKKSEAYDRFYHGEKEMGQIIHLLKRVNMEVGWNKALALWNQYVLENTVPKPDFLTINNSVMTEKELAQPKIQLARIGVSEAYSENLITRMKNGEKEIHDPYSVKYKNGDEANAVFHWKKSDESNLYFLNKWDLSVKKADHENEVQKTFYINDPKRLSHVLKNLKDTQPTNFEKFVSTFTFKGSVNYLCERPVENLYRNRDDQHYLQWDLAKVLPNGKLHERHFHPNYGFDLKKVGDEYRVGIKDLSNSEHAERFFQSLQRGNLQSATFVEKNGKETTLLVTPNISVGYFDIYSEYSKNAKPLTPEQQADKGFISQEFALKVRERINQMEKTKETHRQSGVSEINPGEKKESVKEQKQGESIGKKNKQNEKLNDGNSKPKKKRKPKLS